MIDIDSFDLNSYGRLTSVATKQNNQPVITKAFEYDLLGHTTKETRTIGGLAYVTQTDYDLAGNPVRIVYPDAARTEALYGYNNAGQLEKVQKKEGSTTTDLVTNFDYAETGVPKTIAYANGVTTTQTYDINYTYFLTHKTTLRGTTKLQDIAYAFDPAGNITAITDTSATNAAKTAAYTYDGLSRLTAATVTNAANGQNYSRTFAYDLLGNITNKSDVGAYTYAQTNYASPHAVTGAGGKTYAYDQNGNLTGDGTWTHSWDYKDRLLSSVKTGTTVTYSYDEAGTRITKTNATSGKVTTYVSDLLDIEDTTEKLAFYANGLKLATLENTDIGTGPACSVPQSGDWTVTADCTISGFTTAPGNVTVNPGITLTVAPTGILELDLNTNHLLVKDTATVLIKQGGAIAQTGTFTPPPGGEPGEPTLVFHHPDHLSSASVDTDQQGNVLQLTDYYPYGDSRIEETSGSFHNDYTYTGKERDEDTELIYYEARYYDSHIGRFISLDPAGGDIKDPQSFNKYAYVLNNPLRYVDPSGRGATEFFDELWDAPGNMCTLGKEIIRGLQEGPGNFELSPEGQEAAEASERFKNDSQPAIQTTDTALFITGVGYTAKELGGAALEKLLANPNLSKAVRQRIITILADRTEARITSRIVGLFKDGRVPKASEIKKWAESNGWQAVQEEGKPLKYFVTIQVKNIYIYQWLVMERPFLVCH